MNESDSKIGTKGGEEITLKLRAIIKDYALRDCPVLPHCHDQGSDSVILGRLSQKITVDVGPRVIIQQGELISCSVFICESDFLLLT